MTSEISLLAKPSKKKSPLSGRFERFNLTENPFPAQAFVNKESTDKRTNGEIYDLEIRKIEFEKIETYFLKPPQDDPNHLRLGYLIDSSYIGRGNGKTAFLINLQRKINEQYCLDISENINKSFAIYLAPEDSGRTKTFDRFIDLMFNAIFQSGIIDRCIATLRAMAILEIKPSFSFDTQFKNDESLMIESLNSQEWYKENGFQINQVANIISKLDRFQTFPSDFPLSKTQSFFFTDLITQDSLRDYYLNLKKQDEKRNFIFTYLVDIFIEAGFTGFFVFVDDFERIPDFQSARQKRDFALELRTCLFDGMYSSAKFGFYNFLFVLHAGVPRLIADAWSDSGMENRAPITTDHSATHIIPFKKLSPDHARRLIEAYLSSYRVKSDPEKEGLFPFTREVIDLISENSQLNASKILKSAYELMEMTIVDDNITLIGAELLKSIDKKKSLEEKPKENITNICSTDLQKKANES